MNTDFSRSDIRGAYLSYADARDSEFDYVKVYAADIEETKFDYALVRDPQSAQEIRTPDDVLTGSETVEKLTSYEVKSWIDSVQQFANEWEKKDIGERFYRLSDLQNTNRDAIATAMWYDLVRRSYKDDPTGFYHRSRSAMALGDLVCNSDGAPYVARALSRWNFNTSKADPFEQSHASDARLAALGDQLDGVRARMETGRKTPEKCPGVAGFTEDDWRALEAIKPK